MNPLGEAVRGVMKDDEVRARYPEGLTAGDVLTEIRHKHGGDAFPLCTWLDVHEELSGFYGRPD